MNSRRGPGSDLMRPEVKATKEDMDRFGVDECGCVVFPATVKRVTSTGLLVLESDHCKNEEAVERAEDVCPRVQMPWNPKRMRKNLVINLRRNIGHGQVLEGLAFLRAAGLRCAEIRLGADDRGGRAVADAACADGRQLTDLLC